MKKREPEDEQLCNTVYTIICSIITSRHIKINWLDHTALHNTVYMSFSDFSDMMQGDKENIKVNLVIALC